MPLQVKRVYETPEASDGLRVLVDRLWPRGLSKTRAQVDLWLKELAPSAELRRWFQHEPAKWDEFRRRYFAELDEQPEAGAQLVIRAHEQIVTLLYGSKEERFNDAVALREYLEERARRVM